MKREMKNYEGPGHESCGGAGVRGNIEYTLKNQVPTGTGAVEITALSELYFNRHFPPNEPATSLAVYLSYFHKTLKTI